MLFKQIFEPVSSTYTYLGCEETGWAVLIDPVLRTAVRDLEALESLTLKFTCTAW